MRFPFSNILVTGGAGFIGSNFVRYMLKKYDHIKIINLDKLTYAGHLKNLFCLPQENNHTFIQGPVEDKNLIESLLQSYQVEAVVHFAAESHVDRSIASPDAFIKTNALGTFYLLEACRNVWDQGGQMNQERFRFHHISTDEVYGSLSLQDPPFSEKTPYAPNSPYAASKAASDFFVRSFGHTYGLPITISNCSNNYGPYQHPEKFIPTIIQACQKQKPIPIYGQGRQIRDWLHAEDHCRAIDTILCHGAVGETYNIGGENEWDNLSLAKYICDLYAEKYKKNMDYKSLINFVTDRPGHDFRYAINGLKIKQDLGWKPQRDFNQGLLETLDFYKDIK